MRATARLHAMERGFNPRPPILAGDASAWLKHEGWEHLFQSTPANTGGRCSRDGHGIGLSKSFNPRPPILAGDAAVSTRRDSCMRRFQSTPANTGGRCRCACGLLIRRLVSIHARQYWRAMRARRYGGPGLGRVSIHARQYWRAMPRAKSAEAAALEFQSTPANTGGRCCARLRLQTQPRRFQSTPANTGGRCSPC